MTVLCLLTTKSAAEANRLTVSIAYVFMTLVRETASHTLAKEKVKVNPIAVFARIEALPLSKVCLANQRHVMRASVEKKILKKLYCSKLRINIQRKIKILHQ